MTFFTKIQQKIIKKSKNFWWTT